jgi:hypothetical protein
MFETSIDNETMVKTRLIRSSPVRRITILNCHPRHIYHPSLEQQELIPIVTTTRTIGRNTEMIRLLDEALEIASLLLPSPPQTARKEPPEAPLPTP